MRVRGHRGQLTTAPTPGNSPVAPGCAREAFGDKVSRPWCPARSFRPEVPSCRVWSTAPGGCSTIPRAPPPSTCCAGWRSASSRASPPSTPPRSTGSTRWRSWWGGPWRSLPACASGWRSSPSAASTSPARATPTGGSRSTTPAPSGSSPRPRSRCACCKTDYLDVLLVHRPDWLTAADDTAEGLETLQPAGQGAPRRRVQLQRPPGRAAQLPPDPSRSAPTRSS